MIPKPFYQTVILILSIPFIMSCNPNQQVDLIISNAKIYSVDNEFNIYQSMAIDKGKIVAIGTDESILKDFKSKQIIDLDGKAVYPGFIDPHCHFLGYGLQLQNAWLAGAKSWIEVIDRLKEHHNTHQTHWVQGRGWNQTEWDVKEFPTKELLDLAFPNNPVLLIRIDGHAAIANSFAMELAKINPDTIVAGGEIIKSNGMPTGVLIDNAINLVRDLIPQYSKDEKVNALINAQSNCFAVGLTSV